MIFYWWTLKTVYIAIAIPNKSIIHKIFETKYLCL